MQNTDSDGGLTGLLARTQDWVTGQSRWGAGGNGLVNPGLERQVMVEGTSRQTGGLRSQRAGRLIPEHRREREDKLMPAETQDNTQN